MSAPSTTQLLTKVAGASGDMALATGGSSAVKIFLVLTALSFGMALVLSVTSFTRIIIVLSFLR
ncbi:MAG TPA: flagellar biosynthetic protein FliP, partial [Polyangia bacterium]